MRAHRKAIFATIGSLLVLVGVVGGFVMFLQPWRSCPEIDDSSAGCPATGIDLTLLGVSLLVAMLGIVFLAISISSRREMLPPEAAGPFGKFD